MATAMSVTSEDFINDKYCEDELEVADILVDMRRLMTRFVSCYSFKYNWIFKKKRRSALVSPRKRKFITPLCKEEASSPNTPFCFSVSESDSNPDKTSTPLLLSQKELKKTLKEKNKAQHQIKKSIGRVQKSLDPIMAENSVLKAKKWELQMDGEEKKEKLKDNMTACSTLQVQQTSTTPLIHPHYHIDGVNDSSASTSSQFENQPPPWIHPYQHQHGATLGNDPMCAGPSNSTLFHHHHQPLILHLPYPMLQNHPSQQQQQREVATLQIELNVSASVDDEMMMMNGNMIIKRAQAQQARKNRKRVIRQKKTRGRS